MVYLIVAIIFGAIGAAVGSGKGRTGLGFILGALLSLIGVIIIAVMDPSPDYAQGGVSRGSPGPMSGDGAGPAPSLEARLQKLDALRASGALTEAEHASERARILGSI